ncbi:cell division protein [Anoxybacillus gonensis]|uniref:Cell division protein FtsL n=1 Tax=Anoxybacillus gonensis TaxID=198467 RepID=A0AAW7TIZ3_9BACL|nr:cell division protein FtsL [Anoxybacillus gonensis]AKS37949.1 cell division protein [Anoxybacillus gonensis]KGP60984.1 cell division protein [Anoxybacillus gonensis]MDO0877382.1 cell division protein FtsL [Anoxybacillus gonensis]
MAAVRIQQKVQQREQHVQREPKKKKKRNIRWTFGEKIVFVSFLAFALYSSVTIISNQFTIYHVNKEVQQLQADIQEQQKQNRDLYAQVQELSTYERILAKAKELGLTLNENNVKVVQD